MNQKQNELVEKQAKDAAAGKGFDWRATPFEITVTAKGSDPLCIQSNGGPSSGVGWWSHSEPEPLREQGQRFARRGETGTRSYGRDDKDTRSGKERENTWGEEEESGEAKDAYKFGDYLPLPNDDLYGWLAELRIFVEVSPERRPFFDALDKFIGKYAVGTRGDGVDMERLAELIEALCSQPGGLLVKREAA